MGDSDWPPSQQLLRKIEDLEFKSFFWDITSIIVIGGVVLVILKSIF